MGKQLAIAMEEEDEEAFLKFLLESADIAIYRSWAPAPEAIASFVPDATTSQFWIHNRAFQWEPVFERVAYESKATGEPSTYFRIDTRHAPLVEYSRHALDATDPQLAGRLYWAKLFLSQPDQIAYDLAAFDEWFTSIVRWVRKHGKKVRHGTTEPWCLPGAQRRLQNAL
jgi:hypothetical protein